MRWQCFWGGLNIQYPTRNIQPNKEKHQAPWKLDIPCWILGVDVNVLSDKGGAKAEEPLNSPRQAVMIMQMLDALKKSGETRRAVRIRPVSGQ